MAPYGRVDPKSYTSIRIPKDALKELRGILQALAFSVYDKPPKPWAWTHRGGIWSQIIHLAHSHESLLKTVVSGRKKAARPRKARKKLTRRGR